MRLVGFLLAIAATTLPARAQESTASPSALEAAIKVNGDVADALVAASKSGSVGKLAEISAPGAVYLSPEYIAKPLDVSAIAAWARSCQPTVGIAPEVIAGRVSLPLNRVQIQWQCPAGEMRSGVTIVEVNDGKIVFVRTIVSELLSRVVVAGKR